MNSYNNFQIVMLNKISEIEVKTVKIELLPLKNIYLGMLLHLNEDFDDDLLLDAMRILAVVE